MSKEKIINITCKTDHYLPFEEIVPFQGRLKKRDKKDIDHVVKSILEHGFSFPMFIWNNEGVKQCLDGHGRIAALIELQRQKYVIPEIPVIYIEAESEKEARRKLLEIASVNSSFSLKGFKDFTRDLLLDYSEYKIPGLDLSNIDNLFKPVIDPIIADSVITDKDIKKQEVIEQNKIANVMEDRKSRTNLQELICPHCQAEFAIPLF
jgi:hypothetical protein